MDTIASFELEEWEKEYIQNALQEHRLILCSEKLTEKNLASHKEATILSTFIYSSLNRSLLSQLPNLKAIATRSTGFDHIDINYCKEKGIEVFNVPTYGVHTVAEHTFALILALSRNLLPSIERTTSGDFSATGLTGFDLNGKTIGIIGLGHIGKRVLELSLCFGMKVLAYTRHPEEHKFSGESVSFVSLDELLSRSDIVTLHLPYNSETRHIINKINIHLFKKGSILINTSRGGLVETQALLEGLDQGILKGAGLDVLEEECFLKEERELLTEDFFKTCDIKTQLLNHVLLTRKNVIVTPHNAFNSKEALQQILDTTIKNIKAFLNNSPRNRVA